MIFLFLGSNIKKNNAWFNKTWFKKQIQKLVTRVGVMTADDMTIGDVCQLVMLKIYSASRRLVLFTYRNDET